MSNLNKSRQTLDEFDVEMDGVDDIDLDSRYVSDEFLDDGKDNAPPLDSSILLSLELNAPECQVRTPEQQGMWCERRAFHLGVLAKTLLKFPYCRSYLLNLCDSHKGGANSKLFGVFKGDVDDVRIYYSNKLSGEVAVLLRAYQEGSLQKCSFDEMTSLIVDEYHLSYVLFAMPLTGEILSSHKLAEANPEDNEIGKASFESKYGLSWGMATSLVRILRINHMSAETFKNLLTTTNLRLCVKLSKMYFNSYGGNSRAGFTQKELVNEGVEGLMRAADLYIYGISARFVTYATNWVKLNMSRFAKRNSLTVGVPVHVNQLVQQIILEIRKCQRATPGVLPKKEDIEAALDKKFNDSVWVLAHNQFINAPAIVGCSTTSSEDGLLSFDGFVSAETPDLVTSLDGQKIFSIIEGMIDTTIGEAELKRKKPIDPQSIKISPLQARIFKMSVVDELSNAEIAERLSDELSLKLEAKSVRSEYKRAIECIRMKMAMGKIEL